MAAMEHGRWNVERLSAGWELGKERDPDNKISPYLRPWMELSEEVQGWDLKYVAGWPDDFKDVGLEVYELNDSTGKKKK